MTSYATDEETLVCDWRQWREPELLALHAKESSVAFTKFDKKAIKLVRELADSSYHSQAIFYGKKAIARRKQKSQSAFEALLELVGTTEQDILYSSDQTLAELLRGLNKDESIVVPTESRAFVDPNKSITGIKYTRTALVIEGADMALPVPFRLSGIESMYLLPVGTELVITDITQETWQCHPLISCAREYKNITVYHLRTVK